MISIKIDGLQKVSGLLSGMAKQAQFAAAVALTKTAKSVEKELQKELGAALDNPTPWVQRGTYTKSASKQNLVAEVGIKDQQARYVREHFEAGKRGQKPYEVALSAMGALPPGYKTIPGAGLKLDARGNPNRTQLREILGSLKSRMQIVKGKGKRQQMVGYFVVQPNARLRIAPGVYWRSARVVKPVLVFVREAKYRKVLDLRRIADQVVSREFAGLYSAALDAAIASARP